MIQSGIYAILNLLNGKRYIGSAVNLRARRMHHFCALRKGIHDNSHLQRAFNKYGVVAFGWMILEYVEDFEMLISRENLYLDIFWPSGLLYNHYPAAKSPLGYKHSEETRRKKSEIMLELWADENYRQMQREARGGWHHSDEAKQKNREVALKSWADEEYCRMQYEIRNSVETKQKRSEAMKGNRNRRGKLASPETKLRISVALKKYWACRRATSS